PVIILENKTAGAATLIVSGFASPRVKPTGVKSQPTCALIANNAGNAILISILPFAISLPIKVPTTAPITAPGASNGERNGKAIIKLRIINPITLLDKGTNK